MDRVLNTDHICPEPKSRPSRTREPGEFYTYADWAIKSMCLPCTLIHLTLRLRTVFLPVRKKTCQYLMLNLCCVTKHLQPKPGWLEEEFLYNKRCQFSVIGRDPLNLPFYYRWSKRCFFFVTDYTVINCTKFHENIGMNCTKLHENIFYGCKVIERILSPCNVHNSVLM